MMKDQIITSKIVSCTIGSFIMLSSLSVIANSHNCPTYTLTSSYTSDHFDQGEARICFAFAAADMMSHALKKKILPFDVALKYFRDDQNKADQLASRRRTEPKKVQLTGGYIEDAMLTANGKSICLNDQNFTFENKWIEMSNLFTFLRSSDSNSEVPKEFLSNLSLLKAVPNFVEILAHTSHLPRVEKVFEQMCGDNRTHLDLSGLHMIKKDFHGSRRKWIGARLKESDLINEMVAALSANNPLGIEYDISAIRDLKWAHASTIVAMKFDYDKNQCLALVKDSHGRICNPTAPGVTCIDGMYWASTKEIDKVLSTTIRLQEK